MAASTGELPSVTVLALRLRVNFLVFLVVVVDMPADLASGASVVDVWSKSFRTNQHASSFGRLFTSRWGFAMPIT